MQMNLNCVNYANEVNRYLSAWTGREEPAADHQHVAQIGEFHFWHLNPNLSPCQGANEQRDKWAVDYQRHLADWNTGRLDGSESACHPLWQFNETFRQNPAGVCLSFLFLAADVFISGCGRPSYGPWRPQSHSAPSAIRSAFLFFLSVQSVRIQF